MKKIPLRNRAGDVVAWSLVDDDDYATFGLWRWCLHAAGYAVRIRSLSRWKRETLYLHREILGLVKGDGLQADHINGNPLDNRKKNLRAVSSAVNTQNLRARVGVSSEFRGVSWSVEHQKWQARGILDGRRVYLGNFENEQDAAWIARQFQLTYYPGYVERT